MNLILGSIGLSSPVLISNTNSIRGKTVDVSREHVEDILEYLVFFKELIDQIFFTNHPALM